MIKNISRLVTVASYGKAFKAGKEMQDPGIMDDAGVLCLQGKIAWVPAGEYKLTGDIGDGTKESVDTTMYQWDFYLQYVVDGNRAWWADRKQVINLFKADFTWRPDEHHLVKFGGEYTQYTIRNYAPSGVFSWFGQREDARTRGYSADQLEVILMTIGGTGSNTYGYDANGNQTTRNVGGGTYTLTYQVRATIAGTFTALPAHVEAMYQPDIRGRSDQAVITIAK